MRLKLFALTGTAMILWVAPLYALDKKIAWHRAIQGCSLIAAFGCAITASRTAKKLADSEAYENAKQAMIIADIQDELAVGAYISQQQRREEATKLLHHNSTTPGGEPVETPPQLHQLEAMLHQPSTTTPPLPVDWEIADPLSPPSPLVRAVVVRCKRAGMTQGKTILAVWGVEKSGSDPRYKAARHWYLEIVGQGEECS